jgi:hypothetical protein
MTMINKNELPPELAHRASLLDAQPGPLQALVQYCLALALVEAGRASLISTTPGDTGPVCTFGTATGERVSLIKPPLSDEQEREVTQLLRRILEEEGL